MAKFLKTGSSKVPAKKYQLLLISTEDFQELVHPVLGGHDMEGVTTDLTQELQTVADNIGSKDWRPLLRRLGLKDNDLDGIYHDYSHLGITEMVYQGLRKWTQQKGEKATLQQLLVGLEKIRRCDLVDMLCCGRPVVTNTGQSVLSHIQYDVTEHTVPKQPVSEYIPRSARLDKHKSLSRFLKTLFKSA